MTAYRVACGLLALACLAAAEPADTGTDSTPAPSPAPEPAPPQNAPPAQCATSGPGDGGCRPLDVAPLTLDVGTDWAAIIASFATIAAVIVGYFVTVSVIREENKTTQAAIKEEGRTTRESRPPDLHPASLRDRA